MLAYNNAVYQTALIVSPLVAGAIYTWNHEWVFYSSAILVVLGGLTMAYMCTGKNVKTIGKKMEVSKELPKENAVEVKVEGGEQKEEKAGEVEPKEEKTEGSEPKEEKAESAEKEKETSDSTDKKEVAVSM